MKTESIIDITDEKTKKMFDNYISTICDIYFVEDDKILGQLFYKFKLILNYLSSCYQMEFFAYLNNDLKKSREERELFIGIHEKIMKKFKEQCLNSVVNESKINEQKIAELEKEECNNETSRLKE